MIGFFKDIFSSIAFIISFITSEKIARLRILVTWSVVTIAPSVFIYILINTWQVHIPGVEDLSGNSSLVNMLVGTSILPILFFFTKGLRGYHKTFSTIINWILGTLERRSLESLAEEYGEEEAIEKFCKVDLGRYIAGFVFLEFLIISWAVFSFFFLGGNTTGLAWFGYIADDLLLGALVFILGGVFSIFDSLVESPSVYKLRLPFSKKED